MPNHSPNETTNSIRKYKQPDVIKFKAPESLKVSLEKQAEKRNVSLSAFMRLIASEYLQRNKNI